MHPPTLLALLAALTLTATAAATPLPAPQEHALSERLLPSLLTRPLIRRPRAPRGILARDDGSGGGNAAAGGDDDGDGDGEQEDGVIAARSAEGRRRPAMGVPGGGRPRRAPRRALARRSGGEGEGGRRSKGPGGRGGPRGQGGKGGPRGHGAKGGKGGPKGREGPGGLEGPGGPGGLEGPGEQEGPGGPGPGGF